jgi:hypothetical protein
MQEPDADIIKQESFRSVRIISYCIKIIDFVLIMMYFMRNLS